MYLRVILGLLLFFLLGAGVLKVSTCNNTAFVIDDQYKIASESAHKLDVLENDLIKGHSAELATKFTEPFLGRVTANFEKPDKICAQDNAAGELVEEVTVSEGANSAPEAVAKASQLNGIAPLTIVFSGNESYDEKGIVSYSWQFLGDTLSEANTSYIFESPGVYSVSLTVADQEGLSDTAQLTITVNEGPLGNISCGNGGGRAGERGEKIWCWDNITIPSYSGRTGVRFSNDELKVNSECYERQVTIEGDRVKFTLNPTSPATESWCSRDYNMRTEIRTSPWNIRHAKGTEEWFGWSYTFGDDYVIDKDNQWLFWQVHPGIVGESPHTELMVIKENQFKNNRCAGEIFLVNAANNKEYVPTGITPKAGEKLNIVVHAIWGDSSNGLLQVWINDQKLYDRQVATVYTKYPWGGNAKWGIYKWPWSDTEGVQKSQRQGITQVETFMGTLRMITRKSGDAGYGTNSYSIVAPD